MLVLENQHGISQKLLINHSKWMNRCYAIGATESSFELFWDAFAQNICSLDGIYAAWIYRRTISNTAFVKVSAFSNSFDVEDASISNSFLKQFRLLDKPWAVIKRNFSNAHLFANQTFPQPDNALSVFLLPGYNIDGKIILTVIAEAELSGMLLECLPGMFQNIVEFSNLKFKETDSNYRLLIENQNELIVKVDSEGRFLFVSPTYCKLFGLDSSELIGKSYEPLIHPDDRESTSVEVQKLSTYPHTCYIEQRAKTVLGWRWLAWSDKAILDRKGNIYSIIGVGRDITDQKRVEHELTDSEMKFQKAFRNSPNLMLISTVAEGLILDINDKFVSVLNLKREDLIGKTTSEIGLYKTAHRSEMVSRLMNEGKISDMEFVLSDMKTNQERHGLFSAELIELNGERCLVSIFNDITELKMAQKELDNYRVHLEGLVEQRTARIQEVNDELDRFARSVSHDLKAPLRVLQGFANALIDDHTAQLDEQGLTYLQRINKATLNMEELIDDLLQYSRLTSLELNLSPINANVAIERALNAVRGEIKSGKAVVLVNNDLPEVMSYMPVLVQVLINLISNSLKFVEKGITPKIQISSHCANGKAFISIEDNGIGIPEDKRKRVFEVFERLHGVESYPGTGIGLTIVKKAMERMGGKIIIKSAPEKGTIFELEMQSA